jgi:hypothetical protein
LRRSDELKLRERLRYVYQGQLKRFVDLEGQAYLCAAPRQGARGAECVGYRRHCRTELGKL